jgi:poly [ADP-ribose] polymerase
MSLIDEHHPYVGISTIVEPYCCTLNQTDLKTNKNKFYIMQITVNNGSYQYFVRYGRIGEIGKKTLKTYSTLNAAVSEFTKIFKNKTKNVWGEKFIPKSGKYFMSELTTNIESDNDDDDDDTKDDTKDDVKTPELEDKRIIYLLDLISDVNMLKSSMKRLNIDTKKMPLGRISNKQIESAKTLLLELLKQVQDAEDDKIDISTIDFNQISSKYYTLIPYSCGRRKPPIIDEEKIIEKYLELLEELKNIHMVVKINKKKNLDKYENIYSNIETTITPLDTSSDMYANLCEYVQNTHCPTHNLKLNVVDILKINRKNEVFDDSMGNSTYLFHGSPLCNWASIMKNGLYLDPSKLGVRITGKMFGYGIYWANAITKSFNYCGYQSQGGFGMIAVGKVALGKTHELVNANYNVNKKMLDGLGKHSTHGMGNYSPLNSDTKKIGDTSMPCGKLTKNNQSRYLWYDEFVIYDTSQYSLEYLIILKNTR